MKLIKAIEINLSHPGRMQVVDAVEGDSYTRQVDIKLYAKSNIHWAIPEGVEVLISYVKPDGTAGAYDTLPDGTQAYSIYDNVLSVMLAPQMLTAVGMVVAQVRLTQGDKVLSTCPFGIRVSRSIATDAPSEDYINWRAQYLPQTVGATVGQWLQITQVDEQGRVLAVEPVDAPEGAAAVTSVNGKKGTVVLNADDIGAEEAGAAKAAVDNHNGDENAHPGIEQRVIAAMDTVEAETVEGTAEGLPALTICNADGTVAGTYDGSKPVAVHLPDGYTREELDAALGRYAADMDALIGGGTDG